LIYVRIFASLFRYTDANDKSSDGTNEMYTSINQSDKLIINIDGSISDKKLSFTQIC